MKQQESLHTNRQGNPLKLITVSLCTLLWGKVSQSKCFGVVNTIPDTSDSCTCWISTCPSRPCALGSRRLSPLGTDKGPPLSQLLFNPPPPELEVCSLRAESTASYLPVEDVLSEDDRFLEGLQLVASEGLCKGLSCAGSVPGGGGRKPVTSGRDVRIQLLAQALFQGLEAARLKQEKPADRP